MKTNRKEFLNALALVMPGIANQEVVEQSASFVFTDNKVITFNDEVAVQHPIDIELEGAIRAKEFYSFLNKCTGEEVSIETEDGKMIVKSGRRRTAGIALENQINLPIDEMEIPDKWKKLPSNFTEACKMCSFGVGRDMSKPILTCLHFNGDLAESSDGYRLTQFTLDKAIKTPFTVPANAMAHINKYNPTKYALTEGWVHFQNNENVIYSCRVFLDKYPDTKGFLDFKGSKVEFPEQMKDILERVYVFAKQDISQDEFVKIHIEDNLLTIRSENAVGWAEEQVKTPYKGKAIDMQVNPSFLIEILTHLDSAIISTKAGRAKFKGVGFVHMLCLMAD